MHPTQVLDAAEASAPEVSTPEASTVACPAITLRQAAEYLADHGWIQGAYFDLSASVFTPRACMVGAIGAVCYGGPVEAPAQAFDDPAFPQFEAAVAFLDRYLTVRFGQITYEFNDTKGRTWAQVVVALLQAAEAWDRALSGGAG